MNSETPVTVSARRQLPLLDGTIRQLTLALLDALSQTLQHGPEPGWDAAASVAPSSTGLGGTDAVDPSAAAEDPDRVPLAETLRDDPGLLAWGLLHAWRREGLEPYTVDDLAQWLEPLLPQLLAEGFHGPPRPGTDRRPSFVADPRRYPWQFVAANADWRARCAWSVALARLAERLVPYRQAASRDHLDMLLAVHLVTERNAEHGELWDPPAWMIDELAQLRQSSRHDPQGLAGALQAASQQWGDFEAWRLAHGSSWLHASPPADTALATLSRLAAVGRQACVWRDNVATEVERAKLAGLRELAYGAGHEINNPLTNISLRAQTLMRGAVTADQRRLLESIHAQALRAYEIIADMMLYAKPPELDAMELELGGVVQRAVDHLTVRAAQQSTELSCQLPGEPAWVRADEVQLQVALEALLRNALEACGRGGQVDVTLAIDHAEGRATIVVRDSGAGLNERAREHLFDPFFSGREAGRGLGFGLCKAQRIAQLHGGRVEVLDSSPAGTSMALVLPSVSPVSAAESDTGRFRVHG